MATPKINMTINLGELLSLASLLLIGIVVFVRLEGRVALNNQAILDNYQRIEQIRETSEGNNQRLLKAIYHLSDKIDRLGERLDDKEDRK